MKFHRAFSVAGTLVFCLFPKTPAVYVSNRQILPEPLVEVGNVVEWLVNLIPSLVVGIDGLVHDKEERADFVQNILGQITLFIAGSDKLTGYNTLIVDSNHHYTAQFTDIVAEMKARYPGELFGINHQTYDIFIFKGGSFYLNGDGGFANWAYTGGTVIAPGVVQWAG